MTDVMSVSMTASSAPTRDFSSAPTAEAIERTAEALRDRGFNVRVAEDLVDARREVLSQIPRGAQVHSGASQTLEEIGVTAAIERSGEYDAVRPRLWSMDRRSQADEIRTLGASPDVFLGSAQAVTEAGEVVFASATGSQLGPIASGARQVILAIGVQKVVPDLSSALQRITEYSYPKEDARSRAAYGMPSGINKILILGREIVPGRISIVLVRRPIGF